MMRSHSARNSSKQASDGAIAPAAFREMKKNF